MTRINVKLDSVESGFEPMPPDNYKFRGERFVDGKTNDCKKKMIKSVLVVTEGDYEGRKLWPNFVQDSECLWFLKRYLEACGFDWDEDGFDTEDVPGSECIAKVEDGEPYNDRIRSEAKDFFPIV